MSNTPTSKRGLLSFGFKRAAQAGAMVTEYALDKFVDRLSPKVQRPPGALPEIQFLVACTRCGECVKACPAAAIMKLDDQAGAAAGTPFLDVNKYRPCVACNEPPCITACPTTALQRIPIADAVMGLAVIDRELCTSWTGTKPCEKCFVSCPIQHLAIIIDEQSRPYVDPRHCIGCGICRAACPTTPRAITVDVPSRF